MVAESPVLNQAVAELSGQAFALLRDVHAGAASDAQATAARQLHQLRELARCTGVDLNDVPAYRQSTTSWRAIARLAGSGVTAQQTTQAG
jgi:hypothetical protein